MDEYHDLLTTAYFLKNIAILTAKGTTFRCLLMGTSENEVNLGSFSLESSLHSA